MANNYYGGSIMKGFAQGMQNYGDLMLKKKALDFEEEKWDTEKGQMEAQTKLYTQQAKIIEQALQDDEDAKLLFRRVMSEMDAHPERFVSPAAVEEARQAGTDISKLSMSATHAGAQLIKIAKEFETSPDAFAKILTIAVQMFDLPVVEAQNMQKVYEAELDAVVSQILKDLLEADKKASEQARKVTSIGPTDKGDVYDKIAQLSAIRSKTQYDPARSLLYQSREPLPAGGTETEGQKLASLTGMFMDTYGMDQQTAFRIALPFATSDINSYADIYDAIQSNAMFLPPEMMDKADEIAQDVTKIMGFGGAWESMGRTSQPAAPTESKPKTEGKKEMFISKGGQHVKFNPDAGPISRWIASGADLVDEQGNPITFEQFAEIYAMKNGGDNPVRVEKLKEYIFTAFEKEQQGVK